MNRMAEKIQSKSNSINLNHEVTGFKIKYNSITHINFKNGSEIWYYENGMPKSEVVYNNSKKISETIRWDINGDIIYKWLN